MRKLSWILLLFLFVPLHAQEVTRVRNVRQKIDSMQYVMHDYRDSIRSEIKAYKDSVRDVCRHYYDAMPHELRIGMGDQGFESIVWCEKGVPGTFQDGYQSHYKTNYRYTQHWFAEYLYNVNYWYAFGFIVDYSGVLWDEVPNSSYHTLASDTRQGAFHNIGLLPEVRFSYFNSEYVSLHSSIGIGLNINTGTELDYKGRETAVAPLVNVTLIGLRVGKGRWYGSLELGAMVSMIGMNEMYMLGSRLGTVSVGVRL